MSTKTVQSTDMPTDPTPLDECRFCHVIPLDYGHTPDCGARARQEADRLALTAPRFDEVAALTRNWAVAHASILTAACGGAEALAWMRQAAEALGITERAPMQDFDA